jgi:hypothetical protein
MQLTAAFRRFAALLPRCFVASLLRCFVAISYGLTHSRTHAHTYVHAGWLSVRIIQSPQVCAHAKTVFLKPFKYITIILPRQARDKHSESSTQKESRFQSAQEAARGPAVGYRDSCGTLHVNLPIN